MLQIIELFEQLIKRWFNKAKKMILTNYKNPWLYYLHLINILHSTVPKVAVISNI